MIITKKALSRRALLRGFGTAIALPVLDSMVPALAAPGANPVSAATRMAFLYVPNGIIMKDWTPKGEGKDYEFTKTLKPVDAFRERMIVMSGLDHYNGQALGDGAGDHARASATLLTGARARKTAGSDIQVDAAQGAHLDVAHLVEFCDSPQRNYGFCAISFSHATTLLPTQPSGVSCRQRERHATALHCSA